jgi:hypothetical protein
MAYPAHVQLWAVLVERMVRLNAIVVLLRGCKKQQRVILPGQPKSVSAA